jgi:hypothetical protein
MGVTAALSLGSAAMSAVGSISQGIAENKQAQQNAAIYEAQAQNIREAQKITAEQYRTKQNVLRGQATATAARGGLKISGTTASSISQSIMQLQMDNSYEQYNLEVQRQKALSNAALQRYQGRNALMSGWMNAGSTALKAGIDYHDKYWKPANNNTVQQGTRISGGFAPITNQQTMNGYYSIA